MTRGEMRTILRRHLMDVTPEAFDENTLNTLLNEGLHQVQKEIMKLSPDEFLAVDQRNVIAASSLTDQLYDKPVGMWYEKEVALLDPTTGKYVALDPKPFWWARDLATGVGSVYSHFGRHIFLAPPAAEAITNGLRIIYVYTVDMATDVSVPEIHTALHMAVVYQAKKFALGETGEAAEQTMLVLAQMLGDIPLYYRQSAHPQVLSPDLGGLRQ